MIKIAHRGNIYGPDSINENQPEHLLFAINNGFQVETDIWLLNNKFYLGHDRPEYYVDLNFLYNILDNAWFHCKNFEVLNNFIEKMPNAKFFWHQEDDYTITSNRVIWTYPNKNYSSKSILVVNNLEDLDTITDNIYGVCSDYVGYIKKEEK